MKFSDNLKCYVLGAVVAGCALAACDDDDEPAGLSNEPVNHPFRGSCIVCGIQGQNEIFRDTIADASVSVVTLNEEVTGFSTVDIKDLYIPQTRMTINMAPFCIEATGADAQGFANPSYEVADVPCNINGTEGSYTAVGQLEGKCTAEDTLSVTYDFALGKMPLKIRMEFVGAGNKWWK